MTTIGDCGPHSAGSSKSNIESKDKSNDGFDDFDETEDDVPITGLGGNDDCLPRNSILHVLKKNGPQHQEQQNEQQRPKLAGLHSTSTTTCSSTVTSTNTLGSTAYARHESAISNVSERNTVSFGDKVRVHKHRMTLGDNPSAKGIPITIAWEAEDSEDIDLKVHVQRQQERQQERQQNQEQQGGAGGGALLRPMGPQRRLRIARQNHRTHSLKKVLNDTRKIQNSRITSREEHIETAVETEQNEQKRKDRRKRIVSPFWG